MNSTKTGPIIDSALCRCCRAIKKCRILTAEYTWMEKKEVYSDMIMDCFGILLSHVNDKDKDCGICSTCVVQLRDACAFRQQVLQCEELFLHAKLVDKEPEVPGEIKKTVDIELKAEPEDDISDHNSIGAPDLDDGQSMDYSVDYTEDVKLPKKEETKAELPPLPPLPEPKSEAESYCSSSDSDKPIKRRKKKKVAEKKTSKKKDSTLTEEKQERRERIEKTLKKTHRKEQKIQRYQCSFCMKWFSAKRDNKLHVQRHMGSGKYVCEGCNKNFVTRQELKNHQRVHNKGVKNTILEMPVPEHTLDSTIGFKINLSNETSQAKPSKRPNEIAIAPKITSQAKPSERPNEIAIAPKITNDGTVAVEYGLIQVSSVTSRGTNIKNTNENPIAAKVKIESVMLDEDEVDEEAISNTTGVIEPKIEMLFGDDDTVVAAISQIEFEETELNN